MEFCEISKYSNFLPRILSTFFSSPLLPLSGCCFQCDVRFLFFFSSLIPYHLHHSFSLSLSSLHGAIYSHDISSFIPLPATLRTPPPSHTHSLLSSLSSTLVTIYMPLILGLFGFSSGPFFLLYSAIFVSLSTIPTLPQCIFICAFTKPVGRNVEPPRAHPESEDHFQSVALIDCLEFISCKLTHSFGIVVFLAINYKSPRSPVSSYVGVEYRTRTARAIT